MEITLPPDSLQRFQLDVKCPTCLEATQLEAAAQQNAFAAERREQLLSSVPNAFRQTERAKLPFPGKLDSALRWKFGALGICLHGPTGCGKSRIAWELAKREILAGRKMRMVNAYELSRYPSLFMAGADEAGKFAEALIECDLLVLDDVFKAKQTERIEELLFAVIDERANWDRPCIITLNDTGGSLVGRLSEDRGPALIRRLKEHCFSISF